MLKNLFTQTAKWNSEVELPQKLIETATVEVSVEEEKEADK